MSRRREYDNEKTRVIVQVENCTQTGDIGSEYLNDIMNNGATHIGLFIVAGGGGGAGDAYISGNSGGGGIGGEIKIIEDIPMIRNQAIGFKVGIGGTGGTHRNNGTDGGLSSVTYNNTTYSARGGWGGYNSIALASMNQRPRLEKSGYGGAGGAYKEDYNIKRYYNRTYEDALAATPLTWSVKGEEGIKNPFDSTDTTIYSSGGGAGYNCYNGYDMSSTYPNYGGTGAGRGGYGGNNASTNKGAAATSYGCGGGGGAFSSGHSYSQGGNGYQGIVRIYFYKYV